MTRHVAAFTDVYLPSINGVSYTIDLWRDRWTRRGGRMDVIYPKAEGYTPRTGEHPVASVPAPFYSRYRLGAPTIPDDVSEPDVVHAHTPFTLGIAGLRFARRTDTPFVASYHTVLGERVDQLGVPDRVASSLRRTCRRYERRFYEAADLVVTPSASARRHLLDAVGAEASVEVLSNGIDTEFFRYVDPTAFLRDRGLARDGRPLIGYTGRHSPEKNLAELIEAVAEMDVTLALAGDGPSRAELESLARDTDANVRFLGFLDREELPAFYSALDAFAFPGPIETQGLVALEANVCGTPVVAVDAGALAYTVLEGETGYHYPPGDVSAFRAAIRRTLADRERLHDLCLRRRRMVSVDHTIDRLETLYDRLRVA